VAQPDDVTHLSLAATIPAGRGDWLRLAAAVLRKSGRLTDADADPRVLEALNGATIEGLPIQALGTPDATQRHSARGEHTRHIPAVRPWTAAPWDIRSYLSDPDPDAARAAALSDLEGGANSLWLRVGGGAIAPKQLERVLDGVHLDLAPVVLQPSGDVFDMQASGEFAGILGRLGVGAHPRTNLGCDPVSRFIRSGPTTEISQLKPEKPVCRSAIRALELGVRGFVIDGTVAHEYGAGDSAELGYSLAAGVAVLRELEKLKLEPDKALLLLEFRYAATDDQFLTIAKFRAARLLWDRVAELCGAAPDVAGQAQHAVTSRLMMTRHDSWTNLLRTTVAAFAAGVGGAESITALPFDTAIGIPDQLGRRLARNISHLLISESHAATTADPVGGAYAVEALTWELAEAGWAEFQRIEAAGSIVAAVTDGSLLRRWARSGDERAELIATRRQSITGLSEFASPSETLPKRRTAVDADPRIRSWGEPFDTMRDQPAATPVFLATIGPLAAHTARAGFIRNVLAAGGMITVGGAMTGDDVLAGYRSAGAPGVVCLAGGDRAYQETGTGLIRALRDAGAQRIVLAGKPSDTMATLVDDHVAAGDDVVQFLRRTRRALGMIDPNTADREVEQ
jgi:methylmalonyl-CoA mutase